MFRSENSFPTWNKVYKREDTERENLIEGMREP